MPRRKSIENFRSWYTLTMNEMLKHETRQFDFWSKALAIGDEGWLKEQASGIGLKRFKIQRNENISYAIG